MARMRSPSRSSTALSRLRASSSRRVVSRWRSRVAWSASWLALNCSTTVSTWSFMWSIAAWTSAAWLRRRASFCAGVWALATLTPTPGGAPIAAVGGPSHNVQLRPPFRLGDLLRRRTAGTAGVVLDDMQDWGIGGMAGATLPKAWPDDKPRTPQSWANGRGGGQNGAARGRSGGTGSATRRRGGPDDPEGPGNPSGSLWIGGPDQLTRSCAAVEAPGGILQRSWLGVRATLR